MDQPIRPKANNHHKPRVSVIKRRGWTNYLVRVPVFILKADAHGQLLPVAAGHANVARKASLADAIRAAGDIEALWLSGDFE